jgi:hypothetical protein
MTNKNRGEVLIKLAKNEWILRPTFQAICSIETELEKSIIDVIANLTKNNLTLSDSSVIIFYGMQAYEKHNFTKEEIGKLIFNAGIINILPKLIKFLEYAVGLEEQNG